MNPNIQNREFWESLHGKIPGLLDWKMNEELKLATTTDQLPRDTSLEPNLWMWVNLNLVCPPAEMQTSKQRDLVNNPPATREENAFFLEDSQQPQASTSQQPQASTSQQPQLTEEEEEENTSTALSASHKVGLLRKRQRQVGTQTGARWPRPPLNYCHLIALALKNSPSRGLNVQEIYNFTRQHFPFFQTAPEGWKNTVRHNLCFRGSFEKAPLSPERETTMSRPRSCRWRLTEEGYRRFAEEARALASARFHNIQKSMSQPEMMSILFDL
ncbi:forkhead box protein R1 [Sarcophilus harrisii]|uniref:forkhead box protein R1 n=1 Tax=Sarcophilus harrisii TaxID=9305 RepID=UPI001301ED82|nr:forkhead box protein R1 [Sarcophilus harrisii]